MKLLEVFGVFAGEQDDCGKEAMAVGVLSTLAAARRRDSLNQKTSTGINEESITWRRFLESGTRETGGSFAAAAKSAVGTGGFEFTLRTHGELPS